MDIELSTLDHTPLCDPVLLLTLDVDDVTNEVTSGSRQGRRSDVVCVTASRSQSLTAVVYWFELKLSEFVCISTQGHAHAHWKQAAILFYDELELEADHRYLLETVYCGSCISVDVSRQEGI